MKSTLTVLVYIKTKENHNSSASLYSPHDAGSEDHVYCKMSVFCPVTNSGLKVAFVDIP